MKIILDECFGRRAAHIVIELLKIHKPTIDAHFLIDYLSSHGVKDDVWVKMLSSDWIVITGDRGKKSSDAPLPLLLPRFGITGVYLSASIQNGTGFEKAQSTIAVLPQIIQKCHEHTPDRLRIVKRSKKGGAYAIHLEPWPQVQKNH